MAVGISENGRKYTLTTLLESLNMMPPIKFNEEKNHELFVEYLTQLFYVQCKFVLEILMKCIATLLTWQYKKSNIDRRVKPAGGENE